MFVSAYRHVIYGFYVVQVDGTGTVAGDDRLKQSVAVANGVPSGEEVAAVPINENLFLDEDLDALDDELNELDIDQ